MDENVGPDATNLCRRYMCLVTSTFEKRLLMISWDCHWIKTILCILKQNCSTYGINYFTDNRIVTTVASLSPRAPGLQLSPNEASTCK